MYELSLNILDIAQNSIRARAGRVSIDIEANADGDLMRIEIADDGVGMGDEAITAAQDPFYTTRTTRKVGLGLPYFGMVAAMCGGRMDIASKPGEGTKITATMRLAHIDRAPLGDIGQTVALLAGANPGVDFSFTLKVAPPGLGDAASEFRFDTEAVKRILDGVGIDSPEVVMYMQEHIREGTQSISGGVAL